MNLPKSRSGIRLSGFFAVIVLFLLVGAGSSEAALIPVTPANVKAAADKANEGKAANAADRVKTIQEILADDDTYAGDDDDEDVIEFASGTYDDIGELLITRPLTLRKDPAADGDAVITGELLIQIRSKDVKVEDLTFRDLEIGKVTILREGEVSRNRGHRWEQSGPVEVYFEGVTLRSFFLDRKTKVSAWQAKNGCSSDRDSCPSCPSDGSMPDCKHDYSSYTGQLHRTELGKHMVGVSRSRSEFFPGELASSREEGKEGWPISRSGGVTNWNRGDGRPGWIEKWNISMLEAHWSKTSLGHILINSRWYPSGNDDACPATEAFTGIEITRNSFEGTEMGVVFTVNPDTRNQSNLFPMRTTRGGSGERESTTTDCALEVKIVGNTFRNIGMADSAYLPARNEDGSARTDSAGNPVFLMDGRGNRIPRNNADEFTIELGASTRKATISDNTIERTSYGSIRIQGVREDGEVTISNNLFRISTEGGSRNVDSPIGIFGSNDVEVMIRGNRITYSDSNVPYLTAHYYDFFDKRAEWCGASDRIHVKSTTTIKELDAATEPAIVQSYVPNFPYPPKATFADAHDIDGDRDVSESMTGVVDADEGSTDGPGQAPPARITSLARSSATVGQFTFSEQYDVNDDNGILKSSDIVVGKFDILQYKSCLRTAMILIHQNGVSVVDNDFGYGGDGFVDFAIQMPRGISLAKFSGNNIDNYATSLVDGGFSGSFATRGNYVGLRPRVSGISGSVTLVRTGELSEPIAREQGAVGPRAGMTADSRPVAPRIESASLTAGNMIVVTYNTELDEESTPPASAFTVRYQVEDGRFRNVGVSSVSVSGKTVTLTLASEIPDGASGLTVVYTAPGGAAAVRSEQGNIAAGNQSGTITPADGGERGAPEQPTAAPGQSGGGGDGGCVLASSGSGGVNLGMLLLLFLAVPFAFMTAGRKRRYNAR